MSFELHLLADGRNMFTNGVVINEGRVTDLYEQLEFIFGMSWIVHRRANNHMPIVTSETPKLYLVK